MRLLQRQVKAIQYKTKAVFIKPLNNIKDLVIAVYKEFAQCGKRDFVPAFTLAEFFSPHPTDSRNAAFTLAEVLITLGIIGVVAAMTLPSLISSYKEKETVVKLQKTYSVLQNAYNMAIQENGTVDTWSDSSLSMAEHTDDINNVLQKYLKTVTVCKKGQKGCGSDIYYNKYEGRGRVAFSNSADRLVLTDGTLVKIEAYVGDNYFTNWCKYPVAFGERRKAFYYSCAMITVDINGLKGPNRDGVDLYAFKVFQNRIVPFGSVDDTVWTESFKDMCLKYASKTPTPNWSYSVGTCTAWVIVNKNMDYLRCKDLDLENKTSCK